MSFTDELFKFAFLLLTTCPAIHNTRSLTALVVITENLFLARSMRTGSLSVVLSLLENVATPLCRKLSVAFFAHVTFTETGSTFSYTH